MHPRPRDGACVNEKSTFDVLTGGRVPHVIVKTASNGPLSPPTARRLRFAGAEIASPLSWRMENGDAPSIVPIRPRALDASSYFGTALDPQSISSFVSKYSRGVSVSRSKVGVIPAAGRPQAVQCEYSRVRREG